MMACLVSIHDLEQPEHQHLLDDIHLASVTSHKGLATRPHSFTFPCLFNTTISFLLPLHFNDLMNYYQPRALFLISSTFSFFSLSANFLREQQNYIQRPSS